MPEGTEPVTPTEGQESKQFTPITSQEDLNKVLNERLQRERAKYADYKDLQEKASRLDSIEGAQKTEAQKSADRIAALEQQLATSTHEALRAKVQARHGIADEDADLFLTGTDEATLTRQAERLAGRSEENERKNNHSPREGNKPKTPQGGKSPWSETLNELRQQNQT